MSSQQPQQAHKEVYAGNNFGDQISFTVGFSYAAGFLLGIGRGLHEGFPKSTRMPKKLIMNNFFNAIGKHTTRFGNAFASAGLLYCLLGGTMNVLLEDELDELSIRQKNALCGATTGMLFKSTLGLVPTVVGGIVGASLITSLNYLVDEGNRKGWISFQMKF